MSYRIHMNGYDDIRTLYQIDHLYAWTHDQYFPPVMVEISPTHRCNQRCRYCYADKAGNSGDILGDDIILEAFKQVADAGVKAVLVQGTGEPLIHKALPAAIEAGSARELSIGISTNGVLLNRALQERILEHLLYVRFSVLDKDPRRYAYLHGCSEKQWKDLTDNIESAAALRKKRDLQLALWATVYLYRDNFGSVYDIVKFYKDLGMDYIVVQEASYTEFSPSGKEEYFSKTISKSVIDEMKLSLQSLQDDDFRVKVRFPINDDTYIVGMNEECWKNNYCHGIKFYTIISSDGSVYPCWRFWGKQEYSYGSLYEKTFHEIWKGERRKAIEKFTWQTPPTGDECSICNITKLNEILHRYMNATTRWKDFLI